MAVLDIEEYRQKDGSDILKAILKPTKLFPKGYFYCDACDLNLVKKYTWFLHTKKELYIIAWSYGDYQLRFHREKESL